MARWVVIGGTGYIGGALVRCLLAAGERVLSVSRAPTGPAGCEHLSLNFTPGSDFSRLFLPDDKIIYAAGLSVRKHCEQNPTAARWLNSDCPVRLLRAASAAGAETFVYLSSVKALHPPANRLADEESGVPAKDAYGHSKWLGERQLLAEPVRCRVCVLRPAAVYGGDGAAGSGRAQGVRGLMRIWGRFLPILPASGRRSFISLPDLVSAIRLAAAAPECDRQVYIAAEPRFYDIPAIARAAGARARGSRTLTRLLLAPLRPLHGLPSVRQWLEIEQSELYSAARLRSALPWRAAGRYSQFLRGAS